MIKKSFSAIAIMMIVVVSMLVIWQWWQQEQAATPQDIAYGNGRIEADQIDIMTKYAGRIEQVLAAEGDLVRAGQVLAIMDTDELDSELALAQAQLAQSKAAVEEEISIIAQRQSELTLAVQELNRVIPLVKSGALSQSDLDQKQSVKDSAQAALAAANVRLTTLKYAVTASEASVSKVQTYIDEATLVAPVTGRILYRLAETGEVLASGGKVFTLINLTDIYMEVFLPSEQAFSTSVGSEARIKLDVIDYAIPATVSFISPESQFTPKAVETQTERDKLMFRVKVRIPQTLVMQHLEQVKTGVRGVAYIRLSSFEQQTPSAWPEFLTHLPPELDSNDALPDSGFN
ncbi:HlyD family efflux transporter periplasmic adaptor subunit [Glaciecola sp. XM2]|uniref:HlyD family secretion protein n=1 Tax=Glaciecola sp. XM2 TaxID=1914931 RepID=UPI001BDF57B2|nr:HlyD family efflux transporter periplasmic adaptor subunit [Glaciecola sp. XM2]MBT1450047.1 HlyD family efflux transporter periplasmic adaptor subunit [Glaciecola sp. XM2]